MVLYLQIHRLRERLSHPCAAMGVARVVHFLPWEYSGSHCGKVAYRLRLRAALVPAGGRAVLSAVPAGCCMDEAGASSPSSDCRCDPQPSISNSDFSMAPGKPAAAIRFAAMPL